MTNLVNKHLVSSTVLSDFNSIIKKLNLIDYLFSYEPFNLGFKLKPEEIYLVIDYEFCGNYLIKILDNRNTAQVLKGFKLGKNISNSKIIARNPLTSIGEENSIKYFKLIKINSLHQKNSIKEHIVVSHPTTNPINYFSSNNFNNSLSINCPRINSKSNHERNIQKIMNTLLEMHFGNKSGISIKNNTKPPNSERLSKIKPLNEIIPLNKLNRLNTSNKEINLNEISFPNKTDIQKNKIDFQKVIELQKWKDEVYSILF